MVFAAVQVSSRLGLVSVAAQSCRRAETTERIRTLYFPPQDFGAGQGTDELACGNLFLFEF
jgi:hypothetical protein